MASEDELGGMLFEQKMSAMLWALFLWPAAAYAAILGALQLNAPQPDVTVAAVELAVATALLVAPFFMPARVVRFHEHGFTDRRPLRGTRAIRYSDVEHMTWNTVDPRVGVTMHVKLVAPGVTVAFMRRMDTGGRTEQTLTALRARIAAHVAERAFRRIAAGEAMAWGQTSGPGVKLRQDGITYRPQGFLGRGKDEVVRWGTDVRHAFHQGYFVLVRAGDEKVLFTLACGEQDFFPGFEVYRSLTRTDAGA